MNENDRIRQLRKSLDYTMEVFGSKLGVTKVAISNIENGNRNVTDQMRKSICREFNVNESWLREGTGEMFIEINKEYQLMAWAGRVLSEESTSFKKRFLAMLMSLDEKDWAFLEDKAKMLVELKDEEL